MVRDVESVAIRGGLRGQVEPGQRREGALDQVQRRGGVVRIARATLQAEGAKATPPKAESDERVKIGRKGNRITIDVDADLAPRVEDAIRKLIGELLDRGQDGPT